MSIKIYDNRIVIPNSIKLSNMYENRSKYLEFDFTDVSAKGNEYLVCKHESEQNFKTPLLLSDDKLLVKTFMNVRPGTYKSLIIISDTAIDDSYDFSSDNLLFVSNMFDLTVDEKVTEATNQATKAKEEADRATLATDGKLDKNQGVENSGKILSVGQDGNIIPIEFKGGSDNKLIGTVVKSENPNITDGYQTEIMNLKLYGKSTQETTTGKNFFDVNAVYNEENLDKSFSTFGIWLYPLDLPDGTYTFTAQNAPYTKGGYLGIGVYTEDSYSVKGYIAHPSVAQKVATFELIGNKFIALSNSMSVNETVKSEIGNIQLEEGSTATSYEPYTGGQPSPNPQCPQQITAISQFDGNIRNSFQLFGITKLVVPNDSVCPGWDNVTITPATTTTTSAG